MDRQAACAFVVFGASPFPTMPKSVRQNRPSGSTTPGQQGTPEAAAREPNRNDRPAPVEGKHAVARVRRRTESAPAAVPDAVAHARKLARKALTLIERKLDRGDLNTTVGDLIRLIELLESSGAEPGQKVEVKWVDSNP